MTSEGMIVARFKVSVETKFHIDYSWWEREGRNLRLYLYELLCSDHKAMVPTHIGTEEVDWIDPETAEVRQVDALWESILSCCSHKPDYITETTPLITSIFRALVANRNVPLSPLELHERIGKSTPERILRVLTGERIYYGIVPVIPS